MPHDVSIVTPSYNRRAAIVPSVESSLRMIYGGHARELIVIDDGSTDGTSAHLRDRFEKDIVGGVMAIVGLNDNIGVTGAKNIGVMKASGRWITFMDSDDVFHPDAGRHIVDELAEIGDRYDMIFFRCTDRLSGHLIGPEGCCGDLTLADMLRRGTPGECLPVIRRTALMQYRYIPWMRGSEGLTYLKMLADGLRARVSGRIVRAYASTGDDRLSAPARRLERSPYLAIHHAMTLRYLSHLPVRDAAILLGKSCAYGAASLLAPRSVATIVRDAMRQPS